MIKEEFVLYNKCRDIDIDAWSKELKVSPVICKIMRNRGFNDVAAGKKFLGGTLNDCHSPRAMKDMDKAVDILLKRIGEKARLRVIGDYDVDGICSAFILSKGIRLLGGDVDVEIPHRIYDGYGLSENLIRRAYNDKVNLIITCDNGIAGANEIALAKGLGMEVIVTDHHEVPFDMVDGRKLERLPLDAAAVVDPKQADCNYPFEGICGAVVVYKLMEALVERTDNAALEGALKEFIQFAAIATVCDIMELKDENRIIVSEGIRQIENTENLGLKALMSVKNVNPSNISGYTFGFIIGPCINATGRLDTAMRALELLNSESYEEACELAVELNTINEERKSLMNAGAERCFEYIEENHMENDKVFVIYLPDVHESLAGIIAGKVKEKYFHPAFVLTKGEDGVKGSGRSIDGYDMYANMSAHKEFFTKFGGHKMAAGFSMKEEDIDAFRAALNEDCSLSEESFVKRIKIDENLPFSAAGINLALELKKLEPCGTGNPKPLFGRQNVKFIQADKMGREGQFLKFTVTDAEGSRRRLVYFGDRDAFEEYYTEKFGASALERLFAGRGDEKMTIIYELGVNSYRNELSEQLQLKAFK